VNQPVNLDLSRLSFDQFVELFFDHPEGEQFWYSDARYALSDIAVLNPAVVAHLTQLFSGFSAAVSRYSPLQISHGIWAMFSPSFSVMEALWDSSVPLEKRSGCIRAMGKLFTDFVPSHDAEPLQKCFYMWWHIIVTGFWAHAGQFESADASKLDSEASTLLQTIFETLKQILEMPDPRTQGYALHGLGHLQHPGVRDLIQQYLDRNEGRFTDEHTLWIEQCRDGVVS
jgi:hypothetical protein